MEMNIRDISQWKEILMEDVCDYLCFQDEAEAFAVQEGLFMMGVVTIIIKVEFKYSEEKFYNVYLV